MTEHARERAIPRIGSMTVESPNMAMDPELLETIWKTVEVQKDLEAFEKGLKALKMSIADQVAQYLDDEGTITLCVDGTVCRVSVDYSFAIPKENVQELREQLGEEFYHFVREDVAFQPTPELVALACDADKGMDIRKHLVIRRNAPSVTVVGR